MVADGDISNGARHSAEKSRWGNTVSLKNVAAGRQRLKTAPTALSGHGVRSDAASKAEVRPNELQQLEYMSRRQTRFETTIQAPYYSAKDGTAQGRRPWQFIGKGRV
jgi:hypothetical protein